MLAEVMEDAPRAEPKVDTKPTPAPTVTVQMMMGTQCPTLKSWQKSKRDWGNFGSPLF